MRRRAPARSHHLVVFPLVVVLGLAIVAACDDPVRSVPLGSLQIDSVFPYLDLEQEMELTVTARDLDGEEVRGNRIVWETRDSALVTMWKGVVTAGVEPGVATILASSGGLTDSIRVTIERPVASLHPALPELIMAVGRETDLEVTARVDYAGDWTHSMRFSVADPAIATVSDSGRVVARAHGSTTISVTAGDKSLEIPVTVGESYTLTLLGTLGGDQSQANDINESGQVVGKAQAADGTWHAFLWEDGSMRDLGSGGFESNSAFAINDHGTVVGTAGWSLVGSPCDGCGSQSWIWSDGEVVPLSIDDQRTVVTDVNNRGQVTGHTFSGYGRWTTGEAFVWKDGEVTWIGKYGDAKLARAVAINDAGTVVANMTYDAYTNAMVWENGIFTPLVPEATQSAATSINEEGVIVGVEGSLFTWRDGERTNLPGGDPWDIDSAERIVGWRRDSGFLWDGSSVIDLSNVLPADADYQIQVATAINDAGQIVGYGRRHGSDFPTAFLLTPAP